MEMYKSQCKQDKFINEIIFKGKRNGLFVDIGANDGITYSNTYFFEKELGWNGICFEPLEYTFAKLRSLRSSILINGCAAPFNGVETFFSVQGYSEMLSGLKSKYDARHLDRLYKELAEHGGKVTEIPIQCYDVNEVFKKYNFYEIDFISIDTEGGELEILKAIDFDTFQIKVITVENAYQSAEYAQFMETKNFEKVKHLEADEIYVNKKQFGFLKRNKFKRSKT